MMAGVISSMTIVFKDVSAKVVYEPSVFSVHTLIEKGSVMKSVLMFFSLLLLSVPAVADWKVEQSHLKMALNGGVVSCANSENYYNRAREGAFVLSDLNVEVKNKSHLHMGFRFHFLKCEKKLQSYVWKTTDYYQARQFTHYLDDLHSGGLRAVQINVEAKDGALLAVSENYDILASAELVSGQSQYLLVMDLQKSLTSQQKSELEQGETVRVQTEIMIQSHKRYSNSDGVKGDWRQTASVGSYFVNVFLKMDDGLPKVIGVR
ncbi:MAG: hypothetical protein KDD61_11800 [Bdellovibrionales bacterium]|nr:hypothetical protein [Bdellovibrionales bacterium]